MPKQGKEDTLAHACMGYECITSIVLLWFAMVLSASLHFARWGVLINQLTIKTKQLTQFVFRALRN